MKHLLLFIATLFCLSVSSQEYNEQWIEVTQLEMNGEMKPASAIVENIYAQAKKDGNEPQTLKTFFFRAKYMQVLEEDTQVKIVNSLLEERKTASVPTKAIIESLYAELLNAIYNKNRIAISQRSYIDSLPDKDFMKWGSKNFRDEINAAYARSLENRELLYKIPLENYEAVIDLNPVMRKTNRALYDFLAERFLDKPEFETTYENRKLPTDQYPLLFGTTQEFLALKLPDTLGADFKERLMLCRELESHYLQKNDTYSLQRSTLRRLRYVNMTAMNWENNTIYLNTINLLASKWEDSPFAYRAKLVAAQLYKNEAHKTIHPDYLVKAVALCDAIIAHEKLTDAVTEARNIRNTILEKSLSIQTEKYIAPNRNALAKVTFRNVDSLRISIYRIYRRLPQNYQDNNYNEYRDYTIDSLKQLKPFLEKAYVLPVKKDHLDYTTEIILPLLDKGSYALILNPIGEKADLHAEETSTLAIVQASQFTMTESCEGEIYQFSDRDTGKPIEGVNASAKNKKLVSDKSGKIKSLHTGTGNREKIVFTKDGDTLKSYYYDYSRNYRSSDRINSSVELYLDRAIYRPGQEVFFKGILLQQKQGVFSTVPNVYVNIMVEDGSNNEVVELRLKTNGFGSFTSKFILPKGTTGEFTMSIDDEEEDEKDVEDKASVAFWKTSDLDFRDYTFRVEEYKRPTFSISFNPVKESIKVNTMVTVKGSAKAFSGAPIGGAGIHYRVTRVVNQYYYYEEDDYDEGKQIVQGEITTDAQGNFSITFEAKPDNFHTPEELPVFTYVVYAEVTDINGETRTEKLRVFGGYHTTTVEVWVSQNIDAKKGGKIQLNSQNLNGVFTPVEGDIRVYKMSAPDRLLVKRPWPAPELQSISREEFSKHFPYLPYTEEKDSILKSKAYFVKHINTSKIKELALTDFKGWESGKYRIVFTAKDSLGNEIEATGNIFLVRESDKIPSDNKVFSFRIINSDFNKDGYVKVEIATALPVIYAEVRANCNYETVFSRELEISSRQVLKIPIVKNPETVMVIKLDFIWQNQLFSESLTAFVPRKQENLQIETQTLDNKLLPGSAQTWLFTIKGSKSQSEVLASMYDASLDRFAYRGWNEFNIYSYPHSYPESRNLLTFGLSNGTFKRTIPYFKNPFGTSDRFYTYGFTLFNPSDAYFYAPKQQSRNNKAFAITGTVNDTDGIPIPGAHVYLGGTMEGTVTDFDGVYTLYASPGDKAVFDYFGMRSQTVKITRGVPLNIIMSGNETRLDGVVVDGYRNSTRALSNVAVTTVTSKTIEGRPNASFIQTLQGQVPGLNIETGSGLPGANSTVILRGISSINGSKDPMFIIDGVPLAENDLKKLSDSDILSVDILKDDKASVYSHQSDRKVIVITTKAGMAALQNVKARKEFKETAFFYPNLTTDKKGNVSFTFTTPEALTEWKLRILAHNKNAASVYFEKSFFTQKDIMVVPNMPRFLREKDSVVIFAKVTNLTAEPKAGNALLQLFDAMTMQAVDTQMLNTDSIKPFTIPEKGSTTVSWTIAVPEGLQGVQYKVLAKAGDFTDGEENILPVLPNSMLVTESIPLWVKPGSTKEYTFENLKNITSTTLRHQGITLEYTSNPAWVALQSLPYLMEFEHECAEQVFSRYYANSIAAHILKSNPKIEALFASWRKEGAPVSKLEQNAELKSIILAETPWMLDAQSEDEKKNRMALLFEFDKMKDALDANFKKLEEKQMPSGGFPWFSGGNESEYITRHILAGFGHLEKLGVKPADSINTKLLVKKAMAFMDARFLEDYKWAENYRKEKRLRTLVSVDASALHYLYARSFYLKNYPLNDSLKKAVKPYIDYTKLHCLEYDIYEKGMAALALNRFGESATAKKIVNSLRETSANNDEWGMYWIDNKAGWYWYRAPIETQALLIEAFMEVNGDIKSADAMKVWLIKQKQNKNWPTTKSTSEAVYALLMQGSDWLSVKENTTITLGNSKLLEQKIAENSKEVETGYMKLQWKPEEVTKKMATLKIENKSDVPGYGGFYWQYFEDLDKIKPAQEGIMNISKELYLKINTTEGPQLKRITMANPLKIGDLVTMRLVLTIKEDLEYVHLKDLRAAAFEPVDVLSGYHWKDGLGYYQSTRDAATHFFFDSIKKGTYVLEYDVRVNNAGEYSNGITTLQSMYAPEFSGHTKGIRVKATE